MKWQCTLLQRWLPEYPEGDLPAFWQGRLKAHLDRCPVCRAEQAALREVVAAIQSAPKADRGPEFWDRIFPGDAPEAGSGRPGRANGPGPFRLVGQDSLPGGCPGLGGAAPLGGGGLPESGAARSDPGSADGPERKALAPREAGGCSPGAGQWLREFKNFVNVAKTNGDEAAPDDELDDLDATLAGMAPQEREAFLKKLSQHEKDGSCLTRYSGISWA